MSHRSESLENLVKIINRGISKRIDEKELYRDKNFITHFNNLSTSEHSSKERFSTEKFIVSSEEKQEKEIKDALKNLYFPDEDNVILFNYIFNKANNPSSKKYFLTLIQNLSGKDSPIKFLDGYPELMGMVLAGAISLNTRPVVFFRENDESFIPLTLCFLEEKDLPKFSSILAGIQFQNLVFQIPNIVDIFLANQPSFSTEQVNFLEKFCKQSNTTNSIYETILLYLYEAKKLEAYETFKNRVSRKLSARYYQEKAGKAIEIKDLEGFLEATQKLDWNKSKIKVLQIYYNAIKHSLFQENTTQDSITSFQSLLLEAGIHLESKNPDKNFPKKIESFLNQEENKTLLTEFERKYLNLVGKILGGNATKIPEELSQTLSDLRVSSQTPYHLVLILYLQFLLDSEEIHDGLFVAAIKKLNESFEPNEAGTILWQFTSLSKFKEKLTGIGNFYFISDINLYVDYSAKRPSINSKDIKENIHNYLETFNSNYEKFILESLDSSVEVSNIFNDIRNYNYKYTQSLETAKAAKKILFEDVDFFIDSLENIKSPREKVKLFCNFYNHYFNNAIPIKNKKLEQFLTSNAESLSGVNPEFGARVLGSMFLYSILYDNQKLYNSSIRLIKKQKKHKTDENKNFFYAWEQNMLSSLAGISNLNEDQFIKLCRWISELPPGIKLSSWFITGFTREFYFFVKKNQSTDAEFLLRVVEKLQELIFGYPESIQHIKFYNFISSIYYLFKDTKRSNESLDKSIRSIQNTKLSDQWKDHLLNDTAIQCLRTNNISRASDLLRESIPFSLTKKVNTYLVETIDYILTKSIDPNILTPYLESIKNYCINYYPHNNRLILSFSKLLLTLNKKEESFSLLANSSEDMQAEFMDKFMEFIFTGEAKITPTEILNLMNVNRFSYQSYTIAIIFLLNRNANYDLEFLKLLSQCSTYIFEIENIISAFVMKRAFDLSLEDEYSDSLRRII